MIRYTSLLACLLITAGLQAQPHKARKLVQVMTQQNFYLNSGGRALLGGKSRAIYEVILPPNTVSWYYSFSTYPGQSPAPQISLLGQASKLFDPTGFTTDLVSAILRPTGSHVCDVYLMDANNTTAFINKVDQNGARLQYYLSGSRENFRDGTVQVNDMVNGTLYLGFRNPSGVEGINIAFEVVAVTEETVVTPKTEDQQKADLYAKLAWQSFGRNDFDGCLNMCRKAEQFTPDMISAKCARAMALLAKNDSSYLDSWVDAIAACKKSSNAHQEFLSLQKMINDTRNRNVPLQHADEVLALIEAELKD